MARSTFSGPVVSQNGFVGNVTGNVTGNITQNAPMKLRSYTLSTLPSAAANEGSLIYVSNAGDGEVAFSNGTDWISVVTGAAVA